MFLVPGLFKSLLCPLFINKRKKSSNRPHVSQLFPRPECRSKSNPINYLDNGDGKLIIPCPSSDHLGRLEFQKTKDEEGG